MIQYNSLLSIFKIGIGPSSSHTFGPMKIGVEFCEFIKQNNLIDKIEKINVNL